MGGRLDSVTSKANDAIWSLVCGHAGSAQRKNYKLMVLRAYIDDSVDDGKALILSGYISTAEKWAAFSDEWQEILDMRLPYPIAAFHSADAGKSEEEQERQMFLYRIIERYISAAVCVCIDTRLLRAVYKLYNLNIENINPYYWAIFGIMNLVAQDQEDAALREPIDFIFDERSEKGRIIDAWDFYKKTLPQELLAVTGAVPSFQDDKRVLPLQAADMISWYMLQIWRMHGSIMVPVFPFPWDGKQDYPIFKYEPTFQDLRFHIWKMAKDRADRRGQVLSWGNL